MLSAWDVLFGRLEIQIRLDPTRSYCIDVNLLGSEI